MAIYQNLCSWSTRNSKKDLSDKEAVSVAMNRNSDLPKEDEEIQELGVINPYPTAFPYGNGMVLHFYQQQESSTTKTVHKVINKGLKTYV